MVYRVELYDQDIGFTNDYSNVLHFATKGARDTYFSNLHSYTISNTNFNNIKLTPTTLKIAFNNSENADNAQKYSYCRVLTEIKGQYDYENTYKYYFINGFEVISSSENITVIQFNIELDMWQNYQFYFDIKECNVERSHVDRWDTSGNMIYTKPSNDLYESFVNIKTKQKLIDKAYVWKIITSPSLFVIKETVEIAFCFLSATTGTGNNQKLELYYFPFRLDGGEMYYNFEGISATRTKKFPTLDDILHGNLASLLDVAPSAINTVSILFHTGMTIETKSGTGYWTNDITPTAFVDTSHPYAFGRADPSVNEVPWKNVEEHTLTVSRPEAPTDNADYNTKYEPMLYKNPVMARYVVNGEGSEIFNIPDNMYPYLDKIYFNTLVSHQLAYNILTLSENEDGSIASNSVIGAISQLSGYSCDVINSYWQEYCQTQRSSDRTLMWANILTGGLSETGSTAVTSGIGYRANYERSRMMDLQFTMDTQSSTGTWERQEYLMGMRDMYKSYAKQAMAMSAVGGATAFAANAIGKYVGQEEKEKAIKNKPAQLSKTGNWYGIITGNMYATFYIETICDETTYDLYKNTFMKYGYSIGSVMKPNINSRKYFNYLKTNGAIVTGNLNQSILSKIASIFDNGVTIWHMDNNTKDTLYTYTKENIERSLII